MQDGNSKKKLSDTLMPEVLERLGRGASYTEIREWLAVAQGVEISDMALRKRISKVRVERGEISRAITAQALRGTVVRDLSAMDGIIRRALEDELKARARAWGEDQLDDRGEVVVAYEPLQIETPDGVVKDLPPAEPGSEGWGRLMHTVRTSRRDLMDALELRLELSGADEKSKADTSDSRQALLAKLDKLLPMNRVPPAEDQVH